MIDPKLKKFLEKTDSDKNLNLPVDEFYIEIITHLSESNYLITVPSGAGKTSIALEIIEKVIHTTRVWYVNPTLTLYQTFKLKSAMGSSITSVMCEQEMEEQEGRLVLWTPDILLNYLAELNRFTIPDLVIIDNAEFLDHSEIGTILEECIHALPLEIPVVLMMSPITNAAKIAGWLETVRHRSCRLLLTHISPLPKIPVFLSSDWEMLPLLDKKKLAGKVKRSIKELPGFTDVMSQNFIQRLISFLRNEKLTPSVVVMPSEQACDLAVDYCKPHTKTAGNVLTQPVIMAILDKYPFLKEYPILSTSLSRSAAPYHFDYHPLWLQLVEHFLVFDSIDIVFGTLDSVQTLSTGIQSVVYCLQNEQHGKPFQITRHQIDRITRLTGRGKSLSPGFNIVVHTPNTDFVYIKDLLIQIDRPLTGAFRCDCRKVLGILSTGADSASILERSIVATLTPPFGEFCIEELTMSLREEVPDAKCVPFIQTITGINDIHLKLSLRINKLENLKIPPPGTTKRQLNEEKQELEKILLQIPCEECSHFSLCQKRGSRRFRNLLDSYDEMREKLSKNLTGLKLDFQYYLQCLQAFGFIDEQHQITNDGRLALRTGLSFPQSFMQCFKEDALPVADPVLLFAAAGGFAACEGWNPSQFTEEIDKNMEILRPLFQKIKPILDQTTTRMLRFGMLPPRYDVSKSIVLLAWKKGMDVESLSRHTGISVGTLMKLIHRTNAVAGIFKVAYF